MSFERNLKCEGPNCSPQRTSCVFLEDIFTQGERQGVCGFGGELDGDNILSVTGTAGNIQMGKEEKQVRGQDLQQVRIQEELQGTSNIFERIKDGSGYTQVSTDYQVDCFQLRSGREVASGLPQPQLQPCELQKGFKKLVCVFVLLFVCCCFLKISIL